MDFPVVTAVVFGSSVNRDRLRLAGQVGADRDGRADLRCYEQVVCLLGRRAPVQGILLFRNGCQRGLVGVVHFAVPDIGGADGTAPGGFPGLVGIQDAFAVGIRQPDGSQQGDMRLTVGAHCDAPVIPSGGNCGEQGIFPLGQVGGKVVGVVQAPGGVVRPAGLEFVVGGGILTSRLASDAFAVDIEVIDAESGSIHACRFQLPDGEGLAEQRNPVLVHDGSELVSRADGGFPWVGFLGRNSPRRVCVGDPCGVSFGHIILAHVLSFLSCGLCPYSWTVYHIAAHLAIDFRYFFTETVLVFCIARSGINRRLPACGDVAPARFRCGRTERQRRRCPDVRPGYPRDAHSP